MHILPAFCHQQHLVGLSAAVEYGHIVMQRRILDGDLRMIFFEIVADVVVYARISARDHHQRFAVQLFYMDILLRCQTVLSRNRDQLLVSAERQKAAAGKPCLGITDTDEKIELFSQLFDFRQDPLVIVLKRNKMQLVVRELLVDAIPNIHKWLCRIEKRRTHAEGGIVAPCGGVGRIDGFFGIIDHELCIPIDHLSCGRQADPRGGAFDKLQFQMLFQSIYLLHHRGGRDI